MRHAKELGILREHLTKHRPVRPPMHRVATHKAGAHVGAPLLD